MKKLIVLTIVILGAWTVNAQRQVKKSVPINKGQELFLHFEFAENITIEQWDKNEVYIKVAVNIDDGKGNEYYSLKTEQDGEELKIFSDYGDYYEKKKSRILKVRNTHTSINYTVYVPNNITLKVESISGSVAIEEFNGTLITDLIAGDVVIKKYNGELNLETISGDIDVVIAKAEIRAETLMGTVYSNLDIELEDGKIDKGKNKVYGTINNGGNLAKLETISGNIYIRKVGK